MANCNESSSCEIDEPYACEKIKNGEKSIVFPFPAKCHWKKTLSSLLAEFCSRKPKNNTIFTRNCFGGNFQPLGKAERTHTGAAELSVEIFVNKNKKHMLFAFVGTPWQRFRKKKSENAQLESFHDCAPFRRTLLGRRKNSAVAFSDQNAVQKAKQSLASSWSCCCQPQV